MLGKRWTYGPPSRESIASAGFLKIGVAGSSSVDGEAWGAVNQDLGEGLEEGARDEDLLGDG